MAGISRVLVSGGGVGGLTTATALRRHGVEVDLVEANPDHSVYGVGIIQPNNTLRALDQIGLADACLAQGGAFPGWRIFTASGELLVEQALTSDAAPHLPPVNGITRPRLQKILLDAARAGGAHIRAGVSIADLEQDGQAVDVVFNDGGRYRYDVVIASDGLYSDMRRRLFPEGPQPAYTGEGVWRYNFTRPPEVDWGAIYYGEATKVGLVPMSPTEMYMFIVSHEPDNPRFERVELAEKMRARLKGFGSLIAKLREKITNPSEVVYRPMENLILPAPWYKGRVVVIGDAAHATTPHLAQGAAMAIEDATLLGELLGRNAPLPDLLDEFMRRRFERARYVVETSAQIARWEIEEWTGIQNPDANPGRLASEASQRLMAIY